MARGVFAALAVALAVGVAAATAGVERAGRTLVVTTGRDDGSAGSLRDVIENQARPGDTIRFARPRRGDMSVRLERRLVIPERLGRLTVRGPASVSEDKVIVKADGVTIREITFERSATAALIADRVADLRLVENTFLGIEVALSETVRAEIERNRFRGADCRLDRTARSRVANNDFRADRGDRSLLADSGSTSLLMTGNKLGNGSIAVASGSAIVFKNSVVSPPLREDFAGISVTNPPQGVRRAAVTLDRNEVRSGSIVIKRSGTEGTSNVVEGLEGTGIERPGIDVQAGREVILEDNKVSRAGWGVLFKRGTQGIVREGVLRGNLRAGILVSRGAVVRISQVEMGDNVGPGIDLAPAGVTENDRFKEGNLDLDWPEQLVWDPATGRITGTTCPGCVVEGFSVEKDDRVGNPQNGEGAEFLEDVEADSGGRFEWPSGKLTCEEAKNITFTATSLGKPKPRTSEFSPSPTCAPETFGYSFNGPLKTDFDGPDHGSGRRHVTNIVNGGTACGTDPTKARWSLSTEDAQGSYNPRPNLAENNPAPYHTYRFLLNDVQTGQVILRLRITPTTASAVPEQSGSIVNLTVTPPSGVPITKVPVSSCP